MGVFVDYNRNLGELQNWLEELFFHQIRGSLKLGIVLFFHVLAFRPDHSPGRVELIVGERSVGSEFLVLVDFNLQQFFNSRVFAVKPDARLVLRRVQLSVLRIQLQSIESAEVQVIGLVKDRVEGGVSANRCSGNSSGKDVHFLLAKGRLVVEMGLFVFVDFQIFVQLRHVGHNSILINVYGPNIEQINDPRGWHNGLINNSIPS